MRLGMLQKTLACVIASGLVSPVAHAQPVPPAPPAALPPAPPAPIAEEYDEAELEPGDPRPETTGGALIVCGWIAFGIGATAVFGELTSSSNANGLTRQSNQGAFVVTSSLAAAGLTVALLGHMRRADSKASLEEWRLRHPGAYEESKRAPSLAPEVLWTLAPVVGPELRGVGLGAWF